MSHYFYLPPVVHGGLNKVGEILINNLWYIITGEILSMSIQIHYPPCTQDLY